jgi:hypothetical protein
MGYNSGNNTQQQNSIAIGYNSGSTNQGTSCIAIGQNAGSSGQLQNSIAIGTTAGYQNLGANCISIGLNTIVTGANSVAIGSGSQDTGYNLSGAVNQIYMGNNAYTTNFAGNVNIATMPQLTYTSIPSYNSSQIGYVISGSLTSPGTITSGSSITMASISSLPVGLWSIQSFFNLSAARSGAALSWTTTQLQMGTNSTNIILSTGTGTNFQALNYLYGQTNSAVALATVATSIINIPFSQILQSSGTVDLVVNITYNTTGTGALNGYTYTGTYFIAVRIA